MIKLKYILLPATVCWLASCMVGPDFTAPANDLPASWAAAKPPRSNTADLKNWWKIFKDPQLNRLVDTALKNNPDMKSALLRIRESRERLNISESSLLPSADANSGWGLSPNDGFRSATSQGFSLGGNMSWELDLFGGKRRSIEAARASLMSTEASAGAVRTSLLANVATAYFNWIAACEQLRIAEEQLEIQRKTLSIAQERHRAEFAPKLDVEQAISSVAGTEGTIPALKANVASAKNQLSVLLGSYNSRIVLTKPNSAVFSKTPGVPVGLPSELLRRRPDIIAAEHDLHAATANIGVAISDLYPRFSLTGSVSGRGSDFGDLFRENNNTWSLGGNLLQPLFHGGALRANVRAQEAAAEIAAENYRKALITAVAEVEEALINYGNYTSRMQYLEKANTANKEAYRIALDMYRAGETDFLNVITAQRSWLTSEESLVTMRQNIRKAIVEIARALGGGW